MLFATASGLRLAARRCLVLPPPLSAWTLVEAFALHVLEQSGFGDLATELLQDVVQSVAVAQCHVHPASLPLESPPETQRGPWPLRPGPRNSLWFVTLTLIIARWAGFVNFRNNVGTVERRALGPGADDNTTGKETQKPSPPLRGWLA